jgi:hypothetical protein
MSVIGKLSNQNDAELLMLNSRTERSFVNQDTSLPYNKIRTVCNGLFVPIGIRSIPYSMTVNILDEIFSYHVLCNAYFFTCFYFLKAGLSQQVGISLERIHTTMQALLCYVSKT